MRKLRVEQPIRIWVRGTALLLMLLLAAGFFAGAVPLRAAAANTTESASTEEGTPSEESDPSTQPQESVSLTPEEIQERWTEFSTRSYMKYMRLTVQIRYRMVDWGEAAYTTSLSDYVSHIRTELREREAGVLEDTDNWFERHYGNPVSDEELDFLIETIYQEHFTQELLTEYISEFVKEYCAQHGTVFTIESTAMYMTQEDAGADAYGDADLRMLASWRHPDDVAAYEAGTMSLSELGRKVTRDYENDWNSCILAQKIGLNWEQIIYLAHQTLIGYSALGFSRDTFEQDLKGKIEEYIEQNGARDDAGVYVISEQQAAAFNPFGAPLDEEHFDSLVISRILTYEEVRATISEAMQGKVIGETELEFLKTRILKDMRSYIRQHKFNVEMDPDEYVASYLNDGTMGFALQETYESKWYALVLPYDDYLAYVNENFDTLVFDKYLNIDEFEEDETSMVDQPSRYDSGNTFDVITRTERIPLSEGDDLSGQNTYILSTITGVNAGGNIQFFAIVYRDAEGTLRKEYIFPTEDSLAKGMQKAAATGNREYRNEMARQQFGYSNESYSDYRPLQAYASDQFLFTTDTAIASVERIEIFTRETNHSMAVSGADVADTSHTSVVGQDKPVWSCQDMSVWQVNKMYGLETAGYLSDVRFVDFDGVLLARTGREANFSWAEDTMFIFQPGSKLYPLDNTTRTEHLASREHDMYAFRIDLADVYGAGLESLINAYPGGSQRKLADQGLLELLYLRVRYYDAQKHLLDVRMPVIMNTSLWLQENGMADAVIDGLGQQGTTLCFEGILPGFNTLESASLYLGTDAAEKAGFRSTGESLSASRRAAAETDEVYFDAVCIYKVAKATDVMPGTIGAVLGYEFTVNPFVIRNASGSYGEALRRGVENRLTFSPYTGGTIGNRGMDSVSQRFLVKLTTASVPSATTTDDIYVTFTYQTLNGTNGTTSEYSLKELARSYYGAWAGSVEEFGYRYGIAPGGTLLFTLDMGDVDHFTGAKFRLAGTDDWQMSDLEILLLDSFGTREVTWRNVERPGVASDREVTRNYSGTYKLDLSTAILVTGTEPERTLDFESGSILDGDDYNWSEMRYSMDYEDTKKNLNFSKSRKTYNVAVEVGGDTVDLSGNGDPGSSNLFYFQLVFEQGNSSIVLANQLLPADGFVTGRTAEFPISTNQNYGELLAVRIIPEDMGENAALFDKLYVDNIKVKETGFGGICKEWKISKVGWIDIDYSEEAELYESGRTPKTMGELARTFQVDSVTNAMNILVCVTTGDYPEDDDGNAYQQLSGTVTASIDYINRFDQVKSLDLDVVHAIDAYNTNASAYDLSKSGYEITPNTTNYAHSTDRMFRGNKTDRFVISLDDLKSIQQITFHVNSDVVTAWAIDSVSFACITETNMLTLNRFDEYTRSESARAICSNAEVPEPVFCEAYAATQPIVISMTENEIDSSYADTTYYTSITREPLSENDELNIFIYPVTGSGYATMTSYDIKTAVQYTDVFGLPQQVTARSSTEAANTRYRRVLPVTDESGNVVSEGVFYALNISSPRLTAIQRLTLQADPLVDGLSAVYIDHAVIQRVRAGVVIGTYYFDFASANVVQRSRTVTPQKAETYGHMDEQTVQLQLSEDTAETLLRAEKTDIAVALRYTSTMDPERGELVSKYVFLTDQRITSIRGGKVLEMTFNEPFVGEILGITMATVGEMNVTVDSAIVRTYSYNVSQEGSGITYNDRILKGTYSFATPLTLKQSADTMERTATEEGVDGSVEPLEFTFTTAEADARFESGFLGPVYAEIVYNDFNNQPQRRTIGDIRKYIVEEQRTFATGTIRNVRILMPNARSINAIYVLPIADEGTQAFWTLQTLAMKYGLEGSIQNANRVVATEDNPRITSLYGKYISFLEQSMATYVHVLNGNQLVSSGLADSDRAFSVTAQAGHQVVMRTQLTGSANGTVVEVYRMNGDSRLGAGSTVVLAEDGSAIFTAPKLDEEALYRVEISSADDNSLKNVILITVPKYEEPEEDEDTGSDETAPVAQPDVTGDASNADEVSGQITDTGNDNTADTTQDNTGDTGSEDTGSDTGDASGDTTQDNTGDETGDTTGGDTGDTSGDTTGGDTTSGDTTGGDTGDTTGGDTSGDSGTQDTGSDTGTDTGSETTEP